MRKRIGLAVIGVAVLLLASLSSSAQAANHFRSTEYFDNGGIFYGNHSFTLEVDYNGNTGPGQGVHITGMTLACGEGNWENPATNGISLVVYNDDGVVKWSRGDATDMPNCYHHWTVDINMPDTSYAAVQYIFVPKFDGQPDPGRTSIEDEPIDAKHDGTGFKVFAS